MLLNKIMEECIKKNKKNLYVIHNLQNFINKEQVKDYIKNILMNSATFNLEGKNNLSGRFSIHDQEIINLRNEFNYLSKILFFYLL